MSIREERKKKICDLMEDAFYVPMKEKELAILMQVAPEEREEFKCILNELLSEGKLMITRRGKYQKAEANVLTGTFLGNMKGFGFVEVEGAEEDFFVSEKDTLGAFHKDTVEIVPIPSRGGKRKEAKVIRIVAHDITTLVGTYDSVPGKGYGFVIPDNQKLSSDIFVSKENAKGAVSGHKVVVEIMDYGNGRKSPEGRITEIIGHINDPGVDIMSIVKGFELPVEFSERVMNQVENVAKPVSAGDVQGRLDLRGLQMVTIDGEDAKDLDDAVSLEFDGEIYHLGVHIADVSNYVQENSALDREAKKRGTSVYLVDRVIPMLPHALSNGICSLNAGEDRLALSCLMSINLQGQIIDYDIRETVIRVDERMSYTAVKNILEQESIVETDPDYARYAGLVPMFVLMKELSAILRKKRKERGSIDFDLPECKILLDKEGNPLEIKPYERNVATNLIEDFMLAANETVAQHFYWLEVPFVYRVHGVPDGDRMKQLVLLLQNMGYYMKTVGRKGQKTGSEEIHPKEVQKLIEKIAGTPEETMITRFILRSMQQAKYSVENSGHFGLACKYYCHFTSPIRRYPDLQIHRIIKEQLRGKLNEERKHHYLELLPEVAKQSSSMERRADEAERETEKLKKVQYMEAYIGEEFEGIISSVTAWGMYVELPNTVEGMIHISKLTGDYYIYRENTCELVGEATGRIYKIGMPVKIRVEDCDRFAKTIDFSLVME